MIKLDFQETSGTLAAHDQALVREICDNVDAEIRQHLPGLSPEIHLQFATGGRTIPQLGFGSTAVSKNSISVRIEPAHPDGCTRIIQKHLRHSLFHECHHLVRGWVRHGSMRPRALIDAVICEGLAGAFERDAAGSMPPWCSYPDNVREWLDELLPLPITAPYSDWMFRHPDGRTWVGYRTGAFIADSAIQHSGLSAAELVEVPANEVLRLANLPLPEPIGNAKIIGHILQNGIRHMRQRLGSFGQHEK